MQYFSTDGPTDKAILEVGSENRSELTEHCLKVCLSNSLQQFETSSKANVVPSIIINIARMDTLPGKDIRHIANVANCHDGDGRHSEDWSKEEDQNFLSLGGVLVAISCYSKENIEHSHWEKDDAKDDGTPDRVAILNEGDTVVNIRSNVKEEEPEV